MAIEGELGKLNDRFGNACDLAKSERCSGKNGFHAKISHRNKETWRSFCSNIDELKRKKIKVHLEFGSDVLCIFHLKQYYRIGNRFQEKILLITRPLFIQEPF